MAGPQQEDGASVATVMATDAHGRMLHCFVEHSMHLHGQDYGLLSPVDTPVYLCRWPGDTDAEPQWLADPHQFPHVLEAMDRELQEQGLCLVHSAAVLSVSGELEDMEPANEEDGLDTYLLLASVDCGGEEFSLYGSLDPCFLLARLQQGTAELLAGDQLNQLQPLVEHALACDEEGYHP